MAKRFVDFKGDMVEAPSDLPIIVADFGNGLIVWSRKGKRHQVRYALQVKPFYTAPDAAREMGENIHHHAVCEGKLDL